MPHDLPANCPLFSVLGTDGRAGVAAAVRAVDLSRNDVVFDEGDEAVAVYVVVSGRVAVLKRARDASRESLVALVEAGDVLGEMGLFDGGGRSAQARALEPCRLLEVPYPALRQALDANPGALWSLLGLLARRLRATDETLADAMLLDVAGRTAKRLLELTGPGDGLGSGLTQEELAAMVGASRERVNKAIAGFVRLGWLEWSGRRYRVLDRDRLADRAR